MLRRAGVEVEMAPQDFAEKCLWLNRRFFTAHSLKRPFVTLKWARSADGWLDRRRTPSNPHPAAISTPSGRLAVHRLRGCHDAILVGSGTVLADHPRLDARIAGCKNPLPLVIDYEASLADYLADLYARGITSVLVEGGSYTLQRFIDAGLWDEAREEIAPVDFGDEGCAPAPTLSGKLIRSMNIGPNWVNLYSREACRHVKNL